MSWPTITGHLNALKEAGLVSPERDGQSIRYRLEISAVEEALAFLMDLSGTGRTNEEETPT
ncbi:Transcriptional repressor SdpR [compost metagenome]